MDEEAGSMNKKEYERELKALQLELVKLQYWIAQTGERLVVVFEGRDASGKGGMIKTIHERLNPRGARIVALGTPTEYERGQWYFQRYVAHLPSAGEIALFDRSWYNRAGVERVLGFCTDDEYDEFLWACPEFERMLVRSGTRVMKYWLSVSEAEQRARFEHRVENPMKRWKLSRVDLASVTQWDQYSLAKDTMFEHTDTDDSPWWVVESDDKRAARLNCIAHLLSRVPYRDVTPPEIALPPRPPPSSYRRPPRSRYRIVPARYGDGSKSS